MIDIILVPQGAEYQAVCRGLARTPSLVVPIPVGPVPLSRYLKTWQQTQPLNGKTLLVMGLCGGLVPRHAIADVVLYQDCIDRLEPCSVLTCNADLTDQIHAKLNSATLVRALTSDRLVWSAQEKHQLAQQYGAAVVDMEGFAALEQLHQAGAKVAMLRVVSDNAQHDLPSLTNAIDADGRLRPFPLALGMIRQPIAATRLIRGSLRGLKTLEAIARTLAANDRLG